MVNQTSLPTNRTAGSTGHIADSNTVHQAVNELTQFAQFDPAAKAPIVNSVVVVRKVSGLWPVSYDSQGVPVYSGGSSDSGKRPTGSALVTVMWIGPDPAPPIVTTGDAGMRDNIDLRYKTP